MSYKFQQIQHRLQTLLDAPSVWLLLLVYVLVWTVSQLVSHPNLDPYGDMMENFAWGQTFSLGHEKHPPLLGWVTGLWFRLFPETIGHYFFLSYLNAAVGLAGIAVLAKRLGLQQLSAAAALVMVMALPYSTLAGKLNANTILLAIWPWIAVAWFGAIQERSFRSIAYGVLLGLTAGLGMLGKYYTGVLLVSMALITLATPSGRAWLIRPSPWIALIVFILVLTPHGLWLKDHSFVTLTYVQAQGTGETDYEQLLKFALAPIGYWLLVFAAVQLALPTKQFRNLWLAWLPQSRIDGLFWLCVLPYLISLLFGLSGFVALSSPWGIPLGFPLTLLWLRNLSQLLSAEDVAKYNKRLQVVFQGFLCLVLLVAPLHAWQQGRSLQANYYLPSAEAVLQAEALWFNNIRQDYEWVAGDYPKVAEVVFFGSVDAEVLPAIPHRPRSSGMIFCHLGPVETAGATLCTARAERWLGSRKNQVLTMEFSVSKSGPRFFADVPHLYKAYFYDHQSALR